MLTHPTKEYSVSQRSLWIGLLGGAVAWFVRFLLAYAISEWRCAFSDREAIFLSLTTTAWVLLGVSAVLLALAVAATLIAYRAQRAMRARGETEGAAYFMARTGTFLSGLFAFIIAVESIPIFFFRSQC